MKRSILFSAVAATLVLGASTLPSAALPVSTLGMADAAQGNVIQDVRMSRRHRMRRSSAAAGNASMPSRGAAGQQYGQTTGGPRR